MDVFLRPVFSKRMKLSYSWLNDFIDCSGLPMSEIAEKLTLSTCEIEGTEERFGYLDHIYVVRIETVEKHPHADRLHLCQLTLAKAKHHKQKLQIVCGAPNVRPAMLAALAPAGSRLPVQEGQDEHRPSWRKIEKSRIRGVFSEGMLCSAHELGLDFLFSSPEKAQEGILDFSLLGDYWEEGAAEQKGQRAPAASLALSEVFPFKDTILDVDNKSITHRPDLWCHFGFARELSAIFQRPIHFDPLQVRPKKNDPSLPQKEIYIEKGAALAYYALYLKGVQITPSPLWMQGRLHNIGQKVINNVVDASNYTLFDIGQPNHAFDARRLAGSRIYVGYNKQKHSFRTLDGEEHQLQAQHILIYDSSPVPEKALAIGGIMGGLNSRIEEDTQALLLESATFPREQIRRSIAALKCRSNSAQCFEKGQDPAKAKAALYRIAQLLEESCPKIQAAKVSGHSLQEASASPHYAIGRDGARESRIVLDLEFLQKRLGFPIEAKQAEEILSRLGFQVTKKLRSRAQKKAKPKDIEYKIKAPSYRSQYDIRIAEDIVEELGRMIGYDHIAAQSPRPALEASMPNPKLLLKRKLRMYLSHRARYRESYNYSFALPKHNSLWAKKQAVELKNPPLEHKKELRLSLLPGLLEQLLVNQDRFREIRLFEVGRVYERRSEYKESKLPAAVMRPYPAKEEERFALVCMPELPPASLLKKTREEFLLEELLLLGSQLRGLLTYLLGKESFVCKKGEGRQGPQALQDFLLPLHPGASLYAKSKEGKILGAYGLLHPAWEENFALKRPCLACEFSIEQLSLSPKKHAYRPPSVYPDSYMEISLLLPLSIGSHVPQEHIMDMNIKEIKAVRYLQQYQGPPLSYGQKSVSYELCCRHPEGTLKAKDLQNILDKVVHSLGEAGFPLRT